MSARTLAVLIAGGDAHRHCAWCPSLKYPANPPATSADETIGKRALLYLLMIVLSALLMVAAVLPGLPAHADDWARWNATLVGAGAYIVAVAIVMLVLPTVDETPQPMVNDAGTIVFPGFPADDLFEFRLYSMGTQVIVWVTIGLVRMRPGCSIERALCVSDAVGEPAGTPTSLRVTEVVRLTLVSHAMTDAMAAGRFPVDESLNALGPAASSPGLSTLGVSTTAVSARPRNAPGRPRNCSACGAAIEPRLADLDCGRWRGLSRLGDV